LRVVIYFIITFIIGFCANTLAQNPYIRHFTTRDGLPTSTIYQIFQDSHKFIWFTSDAGVIKFDGANFTSYRKKDGLSSNDVVRIKEDSVGRIWLFNYNGTVNYFYKNKIYNSKNAPFLNSLIGKGFILDFFTDRDKTIHFYNWQREVFSLDTINKTTKHILLQDWEPVHPQYQSRLINIKVFILSKNKPDEWEIWTNFGRFKQNIHKNEQIFKLDPAIIYDKIFSCINHTLYMSNYSQELEKVTVYNKKEKFSSPIDIFKIKTIIEDSKGYLWIAAYDEGVFCMKNNKVIRHFKIKEALGLMQDHEKNIWISTQSEGIYMINPALLEQKHLEPSYFNNKGINLLCESHLTGIWCTNTQSAFLYKNDLLYELEVPKIVQPISLIHQFKDKTLLLGSKSQKLCSYSNVTLKKKSAKIGYTNRRIHPVAAKSVVDDLTGNESVMFEQSKIMFINLLQPLLHNGFTFISERINNAYYNTKNELVVNAKKNYLFKNNKLNPYPELSRFDGTMIMDHLNIDGSTELINIDGDSLFLLKNNKLFNLTDAFNIPLDKQIKKMLYQDSTLYMATLHTIFVCHNPLKALSGFQAKLEPLNISFNNINDIVIHNDSLYIASEDGLTIIANTTTSQNIAEPPIPYIQSILVNNKTYTLTVQDIKLTGENNINLSFGCISYSSSAVLYSYMLEGSENKWTLGTGNGINLVYQNLPKGKYVFKLRVKKSNSAWSKPLELAITIKPTIYEHPGFWTSLLIISSIIIILTISILRRQKLKKIEVDHQLIVMEQKALQSMMNPHFIFNSLGSIQNFLLNNKGKEAAIYLSQFAQLIRQNLTAINTPMIVLDDEIDRLKNYIELERKRLENKFEYSLVLDNELESEEVYIPSMIIQPIVENSIWHGLVTMEEKGFIKINFHIHSPKSLKIIIKDNGIGMKKSHEYSSKNIHAQHFGMQIIEKRLALLSKKYNTETNITYSESTSGDKNPGTIVEIILPFIYNDAGL